MIEKDDIAAGSSRSLFGVPLEVCLCGVWWFIVCGTDTPLAFWNYTSEIDVT